ncbi:MAG TPA: NAD-dependent epimerase/dehydratase family protein, partial [Stellaceae bacterium]|nr:NAD-dependent epimerase/dehydratase family protein [Stellaceae bacterium]
MGGEARIVVTGAAGFIGRALCRALAERGDDVCGLVRGPAPAPAGVAFCPIGSIGPDTAWGPHLCGAEIVVHLATRAHRRGEPPGDEAAAAVRLARTAAICGVRRLVYASSLRAMGARTERGVPFRAADPPRPPDPYGRAKLAIERALAAAAQQTGLAVVILRPPLVYGPAAKGNFRALLRLAATGLPLPFAGIDNRRSLIFLDNLVDLTICACHAPEAAGRVLLARDIDLSTPDLVCALAAGLGRRALLFPLPEPAFAVLRALPGLGPLAARLSLSLEADDRATRKVLGWAPPFPA